MIDKLDAMKVDKMPAQMAVHFIITGDISPGGTPALTIKSTVTGEGEAQWFGEHSSVVAAGKAEPVLAVTAKTPVEKCTAELGEFGKARRCCLRTVQADKKTYHDFLLVCQWDGIATEDVKPVETDPMIADVIKEELSVGD